jgi:tetratricopeptide (TPR) repeat protein
MKSIFVLTFVLLAAQSNAQTPREQFQTAVAVFQKSASEENARKLAELYKQLEPPPAISADAEYHAQKGAAFAELAKEPAEFQKAVAEFEKAIQLAPWVGEYHYNTALMLKSKGSVSDLEAAMRSIKLARLLARDDKEKRDATTLSAKLEAALEVTKERAVKLTEEAAITAKVQLLEGDWQLDVSKHDKSRSGIKYLQTLNVKRDAQGIWRVQFLFTGDSKVLSDYHPYDIQVVGAELSFTYDRKHDSEVVANIRCTGTVVSDGRMLKLVSEPKPFTPRQAAHWREWPHPPTKSTEEFTR